MIIDGIEIDDIEVERILKDRKAFVIHKDRLGLIKFMTDSEIPIFIKAIYKDRVEGQTPNLENETPIVQAAFEQMKAAFDVDDAKYVSKVIRNRENGRKGGLANAKQSLTECYPNLADKDIDKDKDKDKDIDKDNRSHSENKFKNFNGRKYDFDELERDAVKVNGIDWDNV